MTPSKSLTVIGGGPGGYVAALRAAQLGFNVTCIEKSNVGGTCLNVGCIPSKALLHGSHVFEECKHGDRSSKSRLSGVADLGISVSNVSMNLTQLMKYKNRVINTLDKGILGLFRKNKVKFVKGNAQIIDPHTVQVTTDKSTDVLRSDNILIASGSDVISLPGLEIDEKLVISNTGALSLPKVPSKMIVIGGGVIGLELSTVWRRLGADVTVVEYSDTICPFLDADVADVLYKSLKKQGIKFKLATGVLNGQKNNNSVKIFTKNRYTGAEEELESDCVLVSVGRKPYTGGLVTPSSSSLIETNNRGAVLTNDNYQTKTPSIYAIGDVIGGQMLAHKAEEEGVACVERMAGLDTHVNYQAIPSVIYTDPEVSSVGLTEEEARKKFGNIKVGKFPFSANSRARAVNSTTGFVKIIADQNNVIVGCHIIGPCASELIMEGTLAVHHKMTLQDLTHTCHPHPCYSEAVKEAALLALNGVAIHC
ncbi:hypothetical protein RCL1_006656 [Eukaryota sp. TZLM3-RCL]